MGARKKETSPPYINQDSGIAFERLMQYAPHGGVSCMGVISGAGTGIVSPPEYVGRFCGRSECHFQSGANLARRPSRGSLSSTLRWYLAGNILRTDEVEAFGQIESSAGRTYFLLLEAKPGYQVSQLVEYAGSRHGYTQIPNIKARKCCVGV
jgi:hypothetical protein